MNLFEIGCFESFTLSLPGVSLVDQWGARVAKGERQSIHASEAGIP